MKINNGNYVQRNTTKNFDIFKNLFPKDSDESDEMIHVKKEKSPGI